MERQSLDLGLSLGFCFNSGGIATPVPAMEQKEVSRAAAAAAAEDDMITCSPGSPVSSGSGKRSSSGDEVDDDGAGAAARKKLRLSKDQAAVLEECFRMHHTLTPKQKLALSNRLGLRPRQVEVWFQNRRARTKLKQTEVDYEHLKRWCEQLAGENRRLEREVAELRALKSSAATTPAAPPLTTLTMCFSCNRVATSSSTAPNVAGVTTSPAAVAMFPGHHPQFLCGFRDGTGAAAAAAVYGGGSSGLAKAVRAAR
uniref:Homeobox domain-containing protein n=1 Tax=Leersia perrieri TaxID=77586 RepID=A0A0D9WLL7_9ORYZ